MTLNLSNHGVQSLTSFNFTKNDVSDPSKIAQLDLSCNQLHTIQGLSIFSKLCTVNLSENFLGPSLDAIRMLPPTVQVLNLSHNHLRFLALSISDDPFQEKSPHTQLMALSAILSRYTPSLVSLNLSYNDFIITRDDAVMWEKKWWEQWKLPSEDGASPRFFSSLRELYLDGNLNIESVNTLVLGFNKLESLSIANCGVSDLSSISAVASECPKLKSLTLLNNPIIRTLQSYASDNITVSKFIQQLIPQVSIVEYDGGRSHLLSPHDLGVSSIDTVNSFELSEETLNENNQEQMEVDSLLQALIAIRYQIVENQEKLNRQLAQLEEKRHVISSQRKIICKIRQSDVTLSDSLKRYHQKIIKLQFDISHATEVIPLIQKRVLGVESFQDKNQIDTADGKHGVRKKNPIYKANSISDVPKKAKMTKNVFFYANATYKKKENIKKTTYSPTPFKFGSYSKDKKSENGDKFLSHSPSEGLVHNFPFPTSSLYDESPATDEEICDEGTLKSIFESQSNSLLQEVNQTFDSYNNYNGSQISDQKNSENEKTHIHYLSGSSNLNYLNLAEAGINPKHSSVLEDEIFPKESSQSLKNLLKFHPKDSILKNIIIHGTEERAYF